MKELFEKKGKEWRKNDKSEVVKIHEKNGSSYIKSSEERGIENLSALQDVKIRK